MEDNTHRVKTENSERPRSTSIGGVIKEKPHKSQSITTTPTEFIPSQNIEEMLFEEPEEGELLTPSVCTSFFKRKVNQAGISTYEEVKADEKRRTPKSKDEKEVHKFLMGEFKKGINISQLDPLKKREENDKLTPGGLEEIMIYLMPIKMIPLECELKICKMKKETIS